MMQRHATTFHDLWKKERRRHPRISCAWPIRFSKMNGKLRPPLQIGKCKNISQSGMKITALEPLERNAKALIDVDLEKLPPQIQTQELLLASERRILAEVAWRHLNLETGLFEAGIHFIEADRREECESLVVQAASF